jgi:hypothetical protein
MLLTVESCDCQKRKRKMSGRVVRIVDIENACVERYETALD